MPRPERHLFICTQGRPPGHPRGSCADRGGRELFEAFGRELEKRMLFGKVQVTATGCMGPCMTGATVLVYPEGVMYGNVTPNDVAEIFDSHLVGGEPVARLQVPAEIWG